MNRLESIREAEKASHMEVYASNELYAQGSWLAKPVKTILELLPRFEGYRDFRALDLGCGVGRNSIPVAKAFRGIPCRVDCVDILGFAIEKLRENGEQHGVSDSICGIVSDIGSYRIESGCYDLILAVSVLEHVESEAVFARKLKEIRCGLRHDGIVCLVINSGIRETDSVTGAQLDAQFEVNLPTQGLLQLLEHTFSGWEVIKKTVIHQIYKIPRKGITAVLETDVVTFAAQFGM